MRFVGITKWFSTLIDKWFGKSQPKEVGPLFPEYHEEQKNPVVLFYEWSDIERTPIKYNTIFDFIGWCLEKGIEVSDDDLINIYDTKGEVIYATCKKGTPKLIFSNSQEFLMSKI